MALPIADTTVDIDAPIEIIWQVMTDLDAYAAWNPFIVGVTRLGEHRPGAAEVGQVLQLQVRWRDGSRVTSRESITRAEGPATTGDRRSATLAYRFGGWLHDLRLVRGTRVQTVEQTASGVARYRSREEFHGLLAALVPLRRVQDGFERHAQALKRRAETLARRG